MRFQNRPSFFSPLCLSLFGVRALPRSFELLRLSFDDEDLGKLDNGDDVVEFVLDLVGDVDDEDVSVLLVAVSVVPGTVTGSLVGLAAVELIAETQNKRK